MQFNITIPKDMYSFTNTECYVVVTVLDAHYSNMTLKKGQDRFTTLTTLSILVKYPLPF